MKYVQYLQTNHYLHHIITLTRFCSDLKALLAEKSRDKHTKSEKSLQSYVIFQLSTGIIQNKFDVIGRKRQKKEDIRLYS